MGVFGRHDSSEDCGEEAVVGEFSFHVPMRTRPRNIRRKLSVDGGVMDKISDKDSYEMQAKAAIKAKQLNDSVLMQVNRMAQSNRSNRHQRCAKSKVLNRRSDGALLGIMSRVELVRIADEKQKNLNEKFCRPPTTELCRSKDQQTEEQFYDTGMAHKCQKLLNIHANKCAAIKVILFPEEEWARNAPTLHWSVKLNKWLKRYCTVTERRGSQTTVTVGKITQNSDGTLTIGGKFKREKEPDFKLHLSARITQKDFQNGYLMTGALQQGDLKVRGGMEITHFAAIARHQS